MDQNVETGRDDRFVALMIWSSPGATGVALDEIDRSPPGGNDRAVAILFRHRE